MLRKLCLAFVMHLFGTMGLLQAALFVPNLPGGSEYHLVFVTDSTTGALSDDITVYDGLVTADASSNRDLATIEEWKVIGTTLAQSAKDNANVKGPVYRIDGVLIADDANDLWDGSIAAPINVTPGGSRNVDVEVWTSTAPDGTQAICAVSGGSVPCRLGAPDFQSQIALGASSATDSKWIQSGNEVFFARDHHLYGISPPLMVPVVAIPGDFNGDEVVDVQDIDLLAVEIRAGSNNSDFDLTNDNLVNEADATVWINDIKMTVRGDANLNGVFSSTDLLDVFAAGEYVDDVEDNSTWATGDWNHDAEFDSDDLLAAFSEGGYDPEALNAAAVPEPATSTLTFLALGALALRRRR